MSKHVIGFANQTQDLSFIVEVGKSIKRAADDMPNLSLIMRDNAMDNNQALANIHEFVELGVDLAIICHVDERYSFELANILRQHRIRVISMEIPIPLTTFFGINNDMAGNLLGHALGDWVARHWDGIADKILMMADYRLTTIIRQRFELTIKGVQAVVQIDDDDVLHLHSGNIRSIAYENALPVLRSWGNQKRVVIIGGNDDTAMGALDAALELGIQNNVVAGGHGATLALDEFKNPDSRFVVATRFNPAGYGKPMLDLALRMINDEEVPAWNYIDPTLLFHPKKY